MDNTVSAKGESDGNTYDLDLASVILEFRSNISHALNVRLGI